MPGVGERVPSVWGWVWWRDVVRTSCKIWLVTLLGCCGEGGGLMVIMESADHDRADLDGRYVADVCHGVC